MYHTDLAKYLYQQNKDTSRSICLNAIWNNKYCKEDRIKQSNPASDRLTQSGCEKNFWTVPPKSNQPKGRKTVIEHNLKF